MCIRGAFRTLSSICDGAFLEEIVNGSRLLKTLRSSNATLEKTNIVKISLKTDFFVNEGKIYLGRLHKVIMAEDWNYNIFYFVYNLKK